MTEHYTKATVEVSAWCKVCRKNTPHHVAGGKLNYCIPCLDRRADEKKKEDAEDPEYERTLFDER